MMLREDSITLYNYLKEGCSQVGVELFSQVTSNRMRGNGFKLYQRRFRFDISKISSWKALSRLPREVFVSPCQKVFKRYADVALGNIV